MRLGDLTGGLAKALEKKDPERATDARSEEKKPRRKNEAAEKKRAREELKEAVKAAREDLKDAVKVAREELKEAVKAAKTERDEGTREEKREGKLDGAALRNATESENVHRFMDRTTDPPSRAAQHGREPSPERGPKQAPKGEGGAGTEPPSVRNADVRRMTAEMARDPRAAAKHRTLRAAADPSTASPSKTEPEREARPAQRGTKGAERRAKLEPRRSERRAEPKAPRLERKKTERRSFDVAPSTASTVRHDGDRSLDRALRRRKEQEAEAELRGGHAHVEIESRDDLPAFLDGLRETDALGHAHRCRGLLEDGSRCLRRPPEGELYCSAHRAPELPVEPPPPSLSPEPDASACVTGQVVMT